MSIAMCCIDLHESVFISKFMCGLVCVSHWKLLFPSSSLIVEKLAGRPIYCQYGRCSASAYADKNHHRYYALQNLGWMWQICMKWTTYYTCSSVHSEISDLCVEKINKYVINHNYSRMREKRERLIMIWLVEL